MFRSYLVLFIMLLPFKSVYAQYYSQPYQQQFDQQPYEQQFDQQPYQQQFDPNLYKQGFAPMLYQPQLVPQEYKKTRSSGDSLKEYQMLYGAMPPAYPPAKSTVAEPEKDTNTTSTSTDVPVTPEEKNEAEEFTSQVSPENAIELKRVIASQQNELSKIRNQVSQLLDELKGERQRVEQEKAAAAGQGRKNVLNLSIEFPENTSQLNDASKSETASDSTKTEMKDIEEQALQSNKPIPILVIKPDPIQDVEHLSEQIIQQEMSENAIHETESDLPTYIQQKTPEERVTEAISAIDKLEAEKAKIETEARILKKKMQNHNLRESLMQI